MQFLSYEREDGPECVILSESDERRIVGVRMRSDDPSPRSG
jgi:hypothetical protein